MSTPLFKNHATSRLYQDTLAASTTVRVTDGTGAKFPQPVGDGSDYFMVTVEDRRTGQIEIMKCTARATDILTVTRAQEGTSAQDFLLGATVSHRFTAGILADYFNYGYDKATADARFVNAVGDTMTGPLVLPGDPTQPLQAAPKQYVDTKAPIVSPALTGVPTAPTATLGTDTDQIATTAFVNDVALAAGAITEAPVDGNLYARQNAAWHDLTPDFAAKAPLASPVLTGTPTAPTAAPGTSTTQLATTAFVSTADALKAPLASPTFTGDPKAPTPTAGGNDTSIATTAFVTGAITTLDNALSAEIDGKVPEAPNNSNAYVRNALAWVVGYTKAAIDSLLALKLDLIGGTLTGDLTVQKVSPKITIKATSGSALLVLDKFASGVYAYFESRMNGVPRWQIQMGDAAAESGVGTEAGGSNFAIQRARNDGAFLGVALTIDRSTGVVNTPLGLTAPTQAPADSSTKAATTAFVNAAVGALETANRQNMVVNPSMAVSQENGSAAGTLSGYYPVDQWEWQESTDGTGSVQQVFYSTSTSSPGRYALGVTVTVVDASLAATQLAMFVQKLEARGIADLRWGMSTAKPAVLRFTVIGPVGTYCASIRSSDGALSYVAPFAITNSGIYTDFEVAIPGPTSGNWGVDEGLGAYLTFTLASGSTFQTASPNTWVVGNFVAHTGISNFMATLNNTLRITNVGLYADPAGTGKAPEYEVPDFATELMRCQRYWQRHYTFFDGDVTSGVNYLCIAQFPVTVRTTPTVSGVTVTQAGFPAATGTLSPTDKFCQEGRVASATGTGRYYRSSIDINARM